MVDPSEEQIRSYPPASDGSGFPAKASGWLSTARAVDQMTSMYIDGNMFVTEGGVLERFTRGNADGWEWQPPEDELLRDPSRVTLVTGAGDPSEGTAYAYDEANGRILAFTKGGGELVAQYRPVGDGPDWDQPSRHVRPAGRRGRAVDAGLDGQEHVHQAPLIEVPENEGGPSARPSAGASATPSDGGGRRVVGADPGAVTAGRR